MDPFSISVGLITIFKEVYLLSRCLYRATASARASAEERAKLRRDLGCKLLVVQSFGRFYLMSNATTGDIGLDDQWAALITAIFEDLRKSLNDYKRLDDPYYQQFSPFVNDAMCNTKTIEFPLDLDENLKMLDGPATPATSGKITLGFAMFSKAKEIAKESTAKAGRSAKWALYDKKHLEAAVKAFGDETDKLTGLLPFAQSAQFARLENNIVALNATIVNLDAQRLGLVPHAKLIEFNEADEDSYTDINEKREHIVHTNSEDSELCTGTVEFIRPGNKNPDSESILLELKYYPTPEDDDLEEDGPDSETKANVRRLAGLLQISSSSSRELRTLPFKYYVHQPKQERYAFVFGYPLHAEESQPISLYELIKSSKAEHRFPLATRFRVAQMIAQSIGVFHADGWVHKSVCSQSIVFFTDRTKQIPMLDSPYLVDFGYSRPEQGRTYARYQQSADLSSLYLHPDRPKMTFAKFHDIYALGVVLLEIATGTTAHDHFLSAASGLDSHTSVDKAEVKRKFISIARKSIPYHMGTSYMEAVVSCLDDTYRGHTATPEFVEVFQREIIEKLSANQLL